MSRDIKRRGNQGGKTLTGKFHGEHGRPFGPTAGGPPVPPRHSSPTELDKVKSKVRNWDIPTLEQECILFCERATTAEAEVVSCRSEVSDLQNRLKGQDVDVRKAQETVFALAASKVSRAEDDDIIRSKLKGIRSQWKVFAKDWAVKHMSNIKEENKSAIDQCLSRLVEAAEDRSPDGFWSQQNASKAPTILLNAELARFLAKEIISQPFISAFAYASETNAKVEEVCPTIEALNKLYNPSELRKHDGM